MRKNGFLNQILYFSFFFFILAIISLLAYLYLRPRPISGLEINLIGPNEVNSLENYSYTLTITNNSNQNLTETNLKIILSDGAFFVERPQEKEASIFLGNLETNKTFNENLNLFFLNEGGLRENLKFVLSYKIGEKMNVFEKEENFSILVKNPAIKVQIFLPQKSYVNQEFQTSFRIINLTKQKLNNLRIIIEPPANFVLSSSFPPSENYYYEFPVLNPSEIKNISLIGRIQDIKSSGIFSARAQFDFLNSTFYLTKEIAKVNLLENPVVFSIKSTPESKSVPIGSNLYYEIIVENKSQSVLENSQIRVNFSGPFDFSSLNSNGYFSDLDQVLLWNARNKPQLLNFKPGDKVKLNFSISLFQSYPILGKENKNFSAKIRVEFQTQTIPAEIETIGKEYVVWQEDEKKIIGNIIINQELIYDDSILPGTGPFPLQINQPTTLAWHLKIKTIGEDFDNFSLNTRLPLGVNLTQKVGGDAILDNLKFDPKTGVFIYSLNKLPANLGYLKKEMELIFQIVVVPPANIDLGSFAIIPQVRYSAKGSFSEAQINNSLREIYANQIWR